ncbi:hypothetical protein ACIHFC_18095 [Streptomyces sp. NPDC052013]|uniref:hypothetical protein n=1 Tax=Streptomyces sp. NPDC052013 TaxID=3365679 RepID=UPI0037D59DB7
MGSSPSIRFPGPAEPGALGGFDLLVQEAVEWLLSLLFVVVPAACAFGFVGYGFGAVADGMTGRRPPPAVLRGLAAPAGAGAVVVYAWGLLHVAGAGCAVTAGYACERRARNAPGSAGAP